MPYPYLIPYPTAARPLVAMESRKHADWWRKMRGKWRDGIKEGRGERRREGECEGKAIMGQKRWVEKKV